MAALATFSLLAVGGLTACTDDGGDSGSGDGGHRPQAEDAFRTLPPLGETDAVAHGHLTLARVYIDEGRLGDAGRELDAAGITDPRGVLGVHAAHGAQPAGPTRTSLPSMSPPACAAAMLWSAPRSLSSGLPVVSAADSRTTDARHNATITRSSTLPCRRSRTMRPHATGTESGSRRLTHVRSRIADALPVS